MPTIDDILVTFDSEPPKQTIDDIILRPFELAPQQRSKTMGELFYGVQPTPEQERVFQQREALRKSLEVSAAGLSLYVRGERSPHVEQAMVEEQLNKLQPLHPRDAELERTWRRRKYSPGEVKGTIFDTIPGGWIVRKGLRAIGAGAFVNEVERPKEVPYDSIELMTLQGLRGATRVVDSAAATSLMAFSLAERITGGPTFHRKVKELFGLDPITSIELQEAYERFSDRLKRLSPESPIHQPGRIYVPGLEDDEEWKYRRWAGNALEFTTNVLVQYGFMRIIGGLGTRSSLAFGNSLQLGQSAAIQMAAKHGKQTAIAFGAALNAGSVYQEIYKEAREDGSTEENAHWKASIAAAVAIPIAMWIYQKSDWVGRVVGRDPLARTLKGKIFQGFATEALEGAVESTQAEISKYALHTRDWTAENFARSMRDIGEETLLEGLGGAIMGGVTHAEFGDPLKNLTPRQHYMLARQAIKAATGKDLDVANSRDLYRKAREFGHTKEESRAIVTWFETFAQEQLRREGIITDNPYGLFFARMAERDNPAEQVLYSTPREMVQVFDSATKGLSHPEVQAKLEQGVNAARLKNILQQRAGVGKDGLYMSGLGPYLDEKIQSDPNAKLTEKELRQVIHDRRLELYTVRLKGKTTEDMAVLEEIDKLNTQLNTLQSNRAQLHQKALDEQDPQKLEQLDTEIGRITDLMVRIEAKTDELWEALNNSSKAFYEEYSPDHGPQQYEEVIFVVPQSLVETQGKKRIQRGLSRDSRLPHSLTVHFHGRVPGSILMHARYVAYTTPEGKNHLMLYEAQNDQAQTVAKGQSFQLTHKEYEDEANDASLREENIAKRYRIKDLRIDEASSKIEQILEEEGKLLASVAERYPDKAIVLPASYRNGPEGRFAIMDLDAVLKDDDFSMLAFDTLPSQRVFQVTDFDKKTEGAQHVVDPEVAKVRANLANASKELEKAQSLNPIRVPVEQPIKDWVDTIIARFLADAVERGYDSVLIPSGKLLDASQPTIGENKGRAKWYEGLLTDKMLKLVRKYDPKAELSTEVVKHGGKDFAVTKIDISNEARKGIFRDGVKLYSGKKASISFYRDGMAFIEALDKPGSSDLVHELLHGFRRWFIKGEDLKRLEQELGVTDGVWTPEAEERFVAWAFTAMKDMEPPSPKLAGAWEAIRGFMREGYRTAKAHGVTVSESNKKILEGLVLQETQPLLAAWRNIEEREIELEQAREAVESYIKKLNKPVSQRTTAEEAEIARLRNAREQAKQALLLAKNHKEKVIAEHYVKIGESPAEQRKKDFEHRIRVSEHVETKLREGWYQSGRALMAFFGSQAEKVGKTKSGNIFIEMLTDMDAERKLTIGNWLRAIIHGVDSAPLEVRKWLQTIDPETGQSYLNELFSTIDVGKAPEIPEAYKPWVENVLMVARSIHDFATDQAKSQGILRRVRDWWVPTRDSFEYQLPRLLTEDGYRMFMGTAPSALEAFKAQILKNNPELNEDALNKQLAKLQKEFQEEDPVYGARTEGMLEFTRTFRVVPDAVIVDGREFTVFHREPHEVMTKWLERQIGRQLTIKYGGQRRLINAYKHKGVLKEILDIMDVPIRLNKQELIQQLSPIIAPEELNGKTLKELTKMAEKLEIPTERTVDELHHLINLLSPEAILKQPPEKQKAMLKALDEFAKKLGGVERDIPLSQKLWQIKDRFARDIEDDVISKIEQAYANEGGVARDIRQMHQDWIGVPRFSMKGNRLYRTLEFTGSVFGSLMTSMAQTKGIFQTLQTLPGFANTWADMQKMGEAWVNVVDNYQKVYDNALSYGAIKPIYYSFGADQSFALSRLSVQLRESAGYVFQHNDLAELNNLVAFEFGRLIATNWQEKGISKKQETIARRLNLRPDEIAKINAGQMDKTLFAKIVQNMVNETQYITQMGHRKATAELHPLAKLWLPFQNFTWGQFRYVTKLVRELKRTSQNLYKNPKGADLKDRLDEFVGAVGAFLAWLIATGGVASLIGMTQARLKRRPDIQNESFWEQFIEGLWETAVLGPLTTFAYPYTSSNTGKEMLIKSVPYVSALGSVIDMFAGRGRYGEFAFPERMRETIFSLTPAAQALRRNLDHIVYPELPNYMEARANVSHWRRNLPDARKTGFTADVPLRPEYYDVWYWIVRNDIEGAVDAARVYYRAEAMKGVDARESTQKLRASLMARRPLNLSVENQELFKFLQTQTPEKRRQYMMSQMRYTALMDAVAPQFGD